MGSAAWPVPAQFPLPASEESSRGLPVVGFMLLLQVSGHLILGYKSGFE